MTVSQWIGKSDKQTNISGMRPTQPRVPLGCSALVVAETAVAQDECLVNEALTRNFGHRWRYGLLAMPNLERLLSEPIEPHLLAQEIRLFERYHHTEKILILTRDADPSDIERSLWDTAMPFSRPRDIVAQRVDPLARLTRPSTLVVTCGDWRLHGDDGLRTAVKKLYSQKAHVGVLTMTAAVQRLAFGGPEGAALLNQIAMQKRHNLRRVVLLDIADESCRPRNGDASLLLPTRGMSEAASAVRRAFPRLRVCAATAFVDDTHVTGAVHSHC